jgi:hypothetical protein
VNGVLAERGQDIAFAKGDAFDRAVVGKHGDDSIATAGVARSIDDHGTHGGQLLRLVAAAIIYPEPMAGLEQAPRHAAPHMTKSDKSDVHV